MAENAEYEWNFEESRKAAAAKGLEIVDTAPNRLLIDFDSPDTKRFDLALSWLRSRFDLKELARWKSKGGKNWHILLSCAPCDFTKRIALQFALGSDFKRETLALLMQADGHEVSFLFRPTEQLNAIEAAMLADSPEVSE